MDFGLTLAGLRQGLIFYFIFIASLCIREWARAWTIDKLGDPNPAAQGRVTLNPLVHMDLFGSVIFPLVCIFFPTGGLLFGWGKPVIPNPSYFRNPKQGEVLAALSGPAANLALAFLGAVAGGIFFRLDPNTTEIFSLMIMLNVVLAVFNLLPMPPLDGGVILKHAINMAEETYYRIAQWSWLVLLAIIYIPQTQKLLMIIINVACWPFFLLYDVIS
jgi:Zn-dependent protease